MNHLGMAEIQAIPMVASLPQDSAHIDAASSAQTAAQPNLLQELPFPVLPDQPVSSPEAADVASQDKSASPPSKNRQGAQRSQKQASGQRQQKSTQPRQRYTFKQNPREKEIKLLQELYYELLQKSQPSTQHPPLEQILQQQEEGHERERLQQQYAAAQSTHNGSGEPYVEPVVSNLLPLFSEQQQMELLLKFTQQQTQLEQRPGLPDSGREQVQNVPGDSAQLQLPKLSDQVRKPVADPLDQSETRALRHLEQVEWKKYLEKCSQPQSQNAQLSQQQREALATEEWRQMKERALQQFKDQCAVRKQQQELADFMMFLAKQSPPHQTQSGQDGNTQKRPQDALEESALDPPHQKRISPQHDEGGDLAKFLNLFLQPEIQQKKELLGRLNVQDVIDTLISQKRNAKNSKRKTVASKDSASSRPPNQGRQQEKQQRMSLPGRLGPPQSEEVPEKKVEQTNTLQLPQIHEQLKQDPLLLSQLNEQPNHNPLELWKQYEQSKQNGVQLQQQKEQSQKIVLSLPHAQPAQDPLELWKQYEQLKQNGPQLPQPNGLLQQKPLELPQGIEEPQQSSVQLTQKTELEGNHRTQRRKSAKKQAPPKQDELAKLQVQLQQPLMLEAIREQGQNLLTAHPWLRALHGYGQEYSMPSNIPQGLLIQMPTPLNLEIPKLAQAELPR